MAESQNDADGSFFRLHHICLITASCHYADELAPLLACTQMFSHDPASLRAFALGFKRPALVVAGILAKASQERFQKLIAAHTADQLNLPCRISHVEGPLTPLRHAVVSYILGHIPLAMVETLASMPEVNASIPEGTGVGELLTAFAFACLSVRDGQDEAHRTRARQAATVLSRTTSLVPGGKGSDAPDGRSNLAWAAFAGLSDTVQRWLESATPAEAAALLASREGSSSFAPMGAGHNPFSLACSTAAPASPAMHAEQRQGAAQCALLLGLHPSCSPATLGAAECYNLSWACEAGLVPVLHVFLQDARVTADLIQHTDAIGDTAFGLSCYWSYSRRLTAHERELCRQAGMLVGQHPLCDPRALGGGGETQFLWACRAGMVDLVSTWLLDSRVDAALLAPGHRNPSSPLQAACSAYVEQRHLTEEEREGIRACAVMVGMHPACGVTDHAGDDEFSHLYWACSAGLVEVVDRFLHHPLVIAALHVHEGAGDEGEEGEGVGEGGLVDEEMEGQTAFTAACALAGSPSAPEKDRRNGLTIALMLARHPSCHPSSDDLDRARGAGLLQVLDAYAQRMDTSSAPHEGCV